MKTVFNARFAGTSALAAVAAALALAGCNPSDNQGRDQAAYQLPALPATLPLAPGGTTTPAYAPAAALLPASRQIGTARVADPRDDYAYADDAWGFADALGDAPPDYGFYYDDAEPWAWQGYDNSIEFVEPLRDGYRYYYYRPGADTPYFVRDPDYGYGYDGGQLAVVYGRDGRIIPDSDYGPRLDYASRYYSRGRALYSASHERRPVVAANWAARQNAIVDTRRWAAARAAQPAWQQYHQRTEPQQARHWDEEQARRRADTVRFAAWQGNDFRTPPPPRAIPQAWTRASWAHDDHRFAPPAAGFDGDAAARQHAAQKEREAIAAQARQPQAPQLPGRPQDLQPQPGARPGPNLQQQPPQPQVVTGRGEPQHVPFGPGDTRLRGADMAAHQQAERALQAQRQQQAAQHQQAAAQQAAARQQQDRTAASARQAQLQVQQRDAAQARERAQGQVRAQQAAQQQAQVRQRGEAQAQQRVQAEQRQAQLRAGQQAQAQQRQAAQAQERAQAQAQQRAEQSRAEAQQRVQAQAQAQQRQAVQAQQRVQAQVQAQQRQAVQAQQRAEVQAHQRPPAPPPQPRPAPVVRPQPSAPAAHPNPGEHKHEPQ